MLTPRIPTQVRALARVQSRISAEFGGRFIIVSDFYSWRTQGVVPFQRWHQDGAFWTTESCGSGFNLWLVLASGGGHNHSFDVIRNDGANRLWYQRLHRHLARGLGGGNLSAVLQLPKRIAALGPGAAGGAAGSSLTTAGTREPEVSNLPLEAGEALVLRQEEVHQSDQRDLPRQQWRLALGFKVMERGPIARRLLGAGDPFRRAQKR